ncbi:nucleotidyltransferase domain-containing protein [uncultured Veillonella sp.]|uniref:nucleotidyltransferase domain-containing protein n=1 Tax=uncultured Veillonella sp. TaxID=159268 RepID=UPI0026216AA7|nr:nucleotidyltransferase domain-containing protein [uncultured Veillonella sp.]
MRYTEEQLKLFTKPLSETEKESCERALRMIKDVFKKHNFVESSSQFLNREDGISTTLLQGENLRISLFIQGSYANNTNVKSNSDIDIAVVLESTFVGNFSMLSTARNLGFIEVDFNFQCYKNQIVEMLKTFFGEEVEVGAKSIKVRGNTSRVKADIVPLQRFRDYANPLSTNSNVYTKGVILYDSNNNPIINYPEAHIEKGRYKNIITNSYYKKLVRICKSILLQMKNDNIREAEGISSFLVESLLFNIQNHIFTSGETYQLKLAAVINYLLSEGENIKSWKEANDIKFLFEQSSCGVKDTLLFLERMKVYCGY